MMIKINNKKLCQSILLSAFLFCLSLFFGNSARALETFKGIGNNFEINLQESSNLVCGYVNYRPQGVGDPIIKLNGSYATQYLTDPSDNLNISIAYFENVSSGTSTVSVPSSSVAYGVWNCFADSSFNGFATSTPFIANSSNGYYASSTLEYNVGDFFFLVGQNYSGNGGTYSEFGFNEILENATSSLTYCGEVSYTPSCGPSAPNYGYSPIFASGFTNSTGIYSFLDYNPYSHSDDWVKGYLVKIPVISSGGGEEPILPRFNGSPEFSFDEDIFYCPVNTSCRINYSYHTSFFTPSDYYKLYYRSSYNATPEYLGIKPLATMYQLGLYGSGFIIASSTASSTEWGYYDIVPWSTIDNDYHATTTVAIWFTEQLSNEEILEQWGDLSSSTLMTGLGVDLKNLACSQEDWDKAASSTSWFNWTELRCNSTLQFFKIVKSITDSLTNFVRYTGNILKNTFPFSQAIKVKEAWDNSENSSLPEEMGWVETIIDTDGNISMENPALPNMATSSQIIFGKDMAEGYFQTIAGYFRSFSTIIFWGIFFIFSIIARGWRIYKDIKEEI